MKEQEVDRVKQEGAKNNTVSIKDVCSIKEDNYQAKKRTFLKSVFIGIKEGISIPLLPENVLKIKSHFLVKLFKASGKFSVFLIVSGIARSFEPIVYYIIFIYSIFYILYCYVIVYIYIKHFIYLYKYKKFEVRS